MPGAVIPSYFASLIQSRTSSRRGIRNHQPLCSVPWLRSTHDREASARPADSVSRDRHGTGAADFIRSKKTGQNSQKRHEKLRCRINPPVFEWFGANIGYLQRVSMPEAVRKPWRPRVPTWNNSPATRTSTFDPGLGWRRVPVEDEAFPKMRRGWPDEWARGWNWAPA